MKEMAVRLKRGEDLKERMEDICLTNGIDTAVVLTGVGCVYQAKIRLAGGESFYENKENYEIVSLTGTISKGHAHVHISLADISGKAIGGHLCKGCMIDTTCELVLGILEEYESKRVYDPDTGYDEIEFEKVR